MPGTRKQRIISYIAILVFTGLIAYVGWEAFRILNHPEVPYWELGVALCVIAEGIEVYLLYRTIKELCGY